LKNLPVIVLLMLGVACGMAFGQAAAPQPETAEAKFVRLTRFLETQPLADEDKSKRTWLLDWATQSPDVIVVVCDILGPIPGQERRFGGHLLTQMLFGNAAYQIAHPESKEDVVAVQLAGVESSLAAYSAIVAAHPETRIPHFDEMLQNQQGGSLRTSLEPLINEKCSEQGGA
jgi:hypothetical protein